MNYTDKKINDWREKPSEPPDLSGCALAIVLSFLGVAGFFVYCMMEAAEMQNEEKQGIIQNNRELDTTLLTLTGGFIAILVVVGCFVMHYLNPENSLLSPEIMMALIMLPSTLISYAMGKQKGMDQTQNGNTNGATK